ncbi:MAG: hypothetical protein ACR2I0_02750, partial [Rhodoferax sp.]
REPPVGEALCLHTELCSARVASPCGDAGPPGKEKAVFYAIVIWIGMVVHADNAPMQNYCTESAQGACTAWVIGREGPPKIAGYTLRENLVSRAMAQDIAEQIRKQAVAVSQSHN